MATYVELQVTSHFSFLRGASSPEELFAAASVLGHHALALADRGSVAGVVRGWDGQKATGVRMIAGARVDLVDGSGKVQSRVEVPFAQPDFSTVTLKDDSVIVQPGNSLWRIARRTYGNGVQYTVIYEANKDNIRNPDLIYPGQIFNLPKKQD